MPTPTKAADAGPSAGSGPASRASSPTPRGGPSPGIAAASLARPASLSRLSKLMAPARSRSSSAASLDGAGVLGSPAAAVPVVAYADEVVTSGQATPEQRRRSAKAAAQSLLASDPKYKKFASLVDRCLQSFDSVNEWADFISFLSRLLKTLQTPSPSYSEIPRKLIIAKRLAQCLNPALPSGVHAKTLEVYAQVFSMIGPEGLRRDLLIWSSGLFPFFQYASTSVRPALIALYETYYLALGQDLRPATKALILALLPGVEEETGDFFDQVFSLLVQLSEAVSSDFFLQNVFLILVSSSASRLAALNFLSRQLTEPSEALASGPDAGLMIRGIAAVLGDDNMLVRRGGLDLLLKVLPMDGPILKEAVYADRELLVRATAAVVLQRDVSLNRRVYTWLLGQGESQESQVAYFQANSLSLLSRTLEEEMDKLVVTSDMSEAQFPFKVFLSLLDKWEVGEALSRSLAVPVLSSIYAASTGRNRSEVLGLASAVYEAMEPSVLWKELYEGVNKELTNGGTTHLKLVLWLLTAVPQHDTETVTVHVPIMLSTILRRLGDKHPDDVLSTSLSVANALLSTAPESVFGSRTAPSTASDEGPTADDLAYTQVNLDEASAKVRSTLAPALVTSIFGLSQSALKAGWTAANLVQVVSLTQTVIDREVPAISDVNSRAWMAAVLVGLEKAPSFTLVGALVDLALRASRSQLFEPPIDITSDKIMSVVLDSLFRYLRADAAPYHARAVELLWEFNQLAEIHVLESVIARRMNNAARRTEAFDAFGVLWRQSDDAMLPGEIFQVPMFMVLDGLKSDDPQVLRTSETWMRCNLRSYFRILDPLLRRVMEIIAQGKKNPKLYDTSLINYILASGTSLFRFGGQGLSKACQSSEFRKSPVSQFVAHAEELYPEAVNYLDLVTDILSTLLEDNANDQQTLRVQSTALELLLYLVGRGDLSGKALTHIKTMLIHKLTISTQHRRLTLQNTMLHLLHSALTSSDRRARGHRSASSTYSIPEKAAPADEEAATFEQSLIRMIIIGVSASGNRPILQHWVDFVLMTIPHLENKPPQLRALCDCFCEQLRMTMLQLRNTFTVAEVNDTSATITEAEPIMLIGVLERLATVLGSRVGRHDDKDKQNGEGGGFLGYLPIFSVEAPQAISSSKSETYGYLDDIIDALLVTWSVTEVVSTPETDGHTTSNPCAASQNQIMIRTRGRARKALERLFKTHPSELISSCVQVWSINSNDVTDHAIFDCIDALTPSAQKVVDLVTEHMSGKGRGSVTENLALPAFLEAYISRLEGPIAVQVWNSQYAYARDVIAQANTPAGRMLLFPLFRCLTILGKIVSTTSALEDRRLRRDLQETYVKLFDTVLSNLGKLVDTATWERGDGRDLVTADDDKMDASERGWRNIYTFISKNVIGNLRTFLVDNDRIAAVCGTISMNIIVPAFKQRKVDTPILDILGEMTKIPAAVKAWRVPVGDAFNDGRFFKMTPRESAQWKPLVCALMDSDKERITELLGRIAAAPSANIFTNRELETISRSYNLRRLSFVLLAAERNHHLNNLPIIQEKLVDILRTTVVSPRVHSEVYLCLRVLMCRISPQHLANFWPVILAELLRVFEATMDNPPPDESEDLARVLAACKFLDLLLVIQTEDFQIHQWIFVTDTTDAAYPPEGYSPEALMDRLAEILLEHAGKAVQNIDPLSPRDRVTPRRPQLSQFQTLSSLKQLQPFFSRASIETFEGVYANAGVDWDAIEAGLVSEIFEGDT